MSSKSPPRSLSASLNERFGRIAQGTASFTGKPAVFLSALAIVVIWAVSGPFFGYSDTWPLVINTGTTIITFLMVFLIQNTQNRDQMAMQVKLGELILAVSDADDKLAHAEDLTEAELEALHDDCRKRAEHVLGHLQRRQEAGHQKSSRRKRG
jgi:low affinity Fe/Cu permease